MSPENQREQIIVSEHLAELRGRVRLLTCVSGISWTILVLFGGLLGAGLSDWMIHFDDPGLRLVISVGLVTASSVIAWRQLIRPLIQPLSMSFLALRIEHRFPGLHSRVLSAVEFLQHRLDARVGSPEMQRAVVQDALRDLERIEPSDIVEAKAVQRISIAGGILCLLIFTVVILHPLEAATSLKRLALPFANCPWPRQFELKLVRADLTPVIQPPDSPLLIARGDALELYVVDRRGRLPERVWFEHRTDDSQAIEREPLRQTTIRDEKGHSCAAAVVSWIATHGTMQFRATGGDDDTMPFLRIEVVQPPTLESLRVTVTPPKYSGRPPETLPQGVGHVQGLLGTQISIVAVADKPLKSARLRVADKLNLPLTVAEDGLSFTASFSIVEPGMTGYWFELVDQAGFSDPEAPRFELRGVADSSPDVLIESPVADVLLAPNAVLPVKVLAKDDLGLREVRLSYQLDNAAVAKMIPLASADEANDQPLLLSTVDYAWDLAELALEPGSRIVFRAEATDGYDLGPEPHVGKSTPRTITIVSREDKQKEMAGRVGDLLEDLQQASALQQRARQQTGELQLQLNTAAELRMQDIDQLHRIEMDQRQAASRLNRPADGVQSQARQLQEEFRANKLEDSETQQRLTQIVEELERLDREQFPEIDAALTRADKQVEEQGRPGKISQEPLPSEQGPDQKTLGSTESKKPVKPDSSSKEPSNPDPSDSKANPQGTSPQDQAAKSNNPQQQRGQTGSSKSAQPALEAALSDAHSRQSRVLETLTELQDLLSEWRDQRDVSKELNSLIAEQERIQKESAALGQQIANASETELSPQQKADLSKMAERQNKVAEQVESFHKQLQQAADGLKQRDPEAASRFQDAGEELSNDGTADKLREAGHDIAGNLMGKAAQVQQQALQDLRDLDKQLKQEPTDDLEMLMKQIDQAQQEFETLRKQQLQLKNQAQQLDGQANSPQAQEKLQQLRQRQQDLGEKLAQAERALQRLRLRQPTEAAQRAQERMDRLNQNLQDPEQASDAGEEMQQVADDLEQVERELALEKQTAQVRLAIEELEKIEDRLKALVSQQQNVIKETERLEEERQKNDVLTRGQLRTLKDLADVERGLQSDADQMEKSLKVAEVFSLVLRRMTRSLKLAADRLTERETGTAVVTLEKDALKKMESLLLVLKPDEPQETMSLSPPPGGAEQEAKPDKPQKAGPQGESLPQVAQLKLLKAIQEEVLERTQVLEKLRDRNGNLPPEATEELEDLAREQAELADMTRNMFVKMMQSQPEKESSGKETKKTKPADGAAEDDNTKPDALNLKDLDDQPNNGRPARERKGD